MSPGRSPGNIVSSGSFKNITNTRWVSKSCYSMGCYLWNSPLIYQIYSALTWAFSGSVVLWRIVFCWGRCNCNCIVYVNWNPILQSSFTAKYLHRLSQQQLVQLDYLLNVPDNDWQLYYWITGIVYIYIYMHVDHFGSHLQVVRLLHQNLSVRFWSCCSSIVNSVTIPTINSHTLTWTLSFNNLLSLRKNL